MPLRLLAHPVRRWTGLLFASFLLAHSFAWSQEPNPETLWRAARKGDLDEIKLAIASGIDVDAKTHYGATALSFAADRGHGDVVDYLLSQNANPNVKDSFYSATPMSWANMGDHYLIMKSLVKGGADDVDSAIAKAVQRDDAEFVEQITRSGKASRASLRSSLAIAKGKDQKEIAKILQEYLDAAYPTVAIPDEAFQSYTGTYLASEGATLFIARKAQSLTAVLEGVGSYTLDADDPSSFSNAIAKLRFEVEEKKVKGLSLTIFGSEQFFRKLADAEVAQRAKPTKASESSRTEVAVANGEFADSSPESIAADLAISSTNWGQFRGSGARGIADGQNPPIQWNAAENLNVAWKTPLPGLGHSCPVIWGDYVFVTSAISESDSKIRTGLYGDVTSVQDDSQHEFVTYCLDANSGTIVWQKTACTSVPRVKRHLKSTHANSTCATNGQYVVSWFGSEGVYCYTFDGELVWKKDLGLLDSGWFYDRDYQWQFGASPVIHEDRLILLCDIQDQSFIATYELSTGQEVWKTERDEIPSWTTPTVVNTPGGLQIVTNATKAARGYDFATGKQLWAIERNSEIAVPTPFSAHGLIYVSSGYRPIQPIYAIRLDAQGDLTLDEGTTQSEYVSWSQPKGGPYMPTPLVYGDYLYVCSNSGILTCHHASTGAEVYKERLPTKGNRSFVGSPVAADGHLYLTSEEGETAVIQAGPTFKLVTNNFCGENCLTTPAISQGKLFIRTQQHVFAFATQDDTTTAGGQP